jgi:transcriptional regulator with XRE-family HTH domain
MTLQDLARASSVSVSMLSAVERGEKAAIDSGVIVRRAAAIIIRPRQGAGSPTPRII